MCKYMGLFFLFGFSPIRFSFSLSVMIANEVFLVWTASWIKRRLEEVS